LKERALSTYQLRKLSCYQDRHRLCEQFHFLNDDTSGLRFVYRGAAVEGSQLGRRIYAYTSPLLIGADHGVNNFRFKLGEMMRVQDVRVVYGTWQALWDNPIIQSDRRAIIVLESNDTKVIRHF
jgi:hypothetical protein